MKQLLLLLILVLGLQIQSSEKTIVSSSAKAGGISQQGRSSSTMPTQVLSTSSSANTDRKIGIASWYDQTNLLRSDYLALAGGGFGVASPNYSKGTILTIKNPINGKVIKATVVDFCQCYVGTEKERVLDLSKEAFLELSGNLNLGLIQVEIYE